MSKKAVQTIKIIGKIGSYALFVLLFAVLLIAVFSRLSGGSPNVFGYQVNVIASGSMEPKLSVGDVILSKTYQGQKLDAGDIITYRGEVGDYAGKLITHQIRTVNPDGTLTTYGIATGTDDPKVSLRQVQSVLVRKSPVISFIYSIVSSPIAFVGLVILPLTVMIVMEIVSIVKQMKDKEVDNSEK